MTGETTVVTRVDDGAAAGPAPLGFRAFLAMVERALEEGFGEPLLSAMRSGEVKVPVVSLMVAALVYRLLKRHGIDVFDRLEKELEKPGLFGGEMRGILDLVAELVEVECDG